MKKSVYLKVFVFVLVICVSIAVGWYFFTRYSSQSRASQDSARVSYDQDALPTGEGEEADITVQIQTPQGVSAFNIVLESPNGMVFGSVGESIQTVPPDKADDFSKILTFTSDDKQTAKVSYAVISGSDSDLAKIVSIPIEVINTGGGDGQLTVATTESEVSGPEGVRYAIESDNAPSSDSGDSEAPITSSPSERSVSPSAQNEGSPRITEADSEQTPQNSDNETGELENNNRNIGDTQPEQEELESDPTPVADNGPVRIIVAARFQGVQNQTIIDRDPLPAVITVAEPDGEEFVSNTSFEHQANGIWEATASFSDDVVDVPVQIYIKGGKHIQRKVCEATPTEETGGDYSCAEETVTLTEGTNNLDLTGIVLFAGDVTSVSGKQDGLIDSTDLAFIRNNLGSEESRIVTQGDLNMDGRIDTQDYGLISASLSQLPSNTDED
jgi:hypothetical protein